MTEEIKNVEEKNNTCFCQSKSFKKFLVIATGTFVGVFCALSLFAALHRPPMMHHNHHMIRPIGCPCHHHFYQGHHAKHKGMHKKHFRGEFEHKFEKKDSIKSESMNKKVQ